MIRPQAHRAVVALLLAALDLPPDARAVRDVAATDPRAIIDTARGHRLLQALAPGLAPGMPLAAAMEEDAVLFLREMRAGNARRNARLAASLAEAGRVLAAGNLEAVALKGGAELAATGDAPARFIGDLDLLLPAAHVQTAQRLLIAAGWQEDAMAAIERQRHHHLPPLVHPDHPGMIELHRRLGSRPVDAALPAEDVIARSSATALLGIRVPDAADRLAHLALHAQFGQPGWAERRLRLCDVADLERLLGDPKADPAGARARCAAAEQGAALDGLIEAAHLILPERVSAPRCASRQARLWARASVARIGRTGALRRAYIARRARARLREFVHDADRRAHWRRRLFEPGAWRRAWAAFLRTLRAIR